MSEYSRGVIIDTVTSESIAFDYYDPPTKSGSDADWAETPIRLRSQPHFTYVSTGAPSFSISGLIVGSVDQGDNRNSVNVQKDVQFLQSLTYPEYISNQGAVKPPHRARIWLRGIMDHWGVIRGLSFENTDTYDANGGPLVVKVSFNFTVIYSLPPSYEEIRLGTESR